MTVTAQGKDHQNNDVAVVQKLQEIVGEKQHRIKLYGSNHYRIMIYVVVHAHFPASLNAEEIGIVKDLYWGPDELSSNRISKSDFPSCA